MKISEQWLREWANPPVDTAGLVERLTMAGLEVDGVEAAAPALDGVVVGRVLDKRPHPNADKLSLCTVDVGDGESLAIVCGARNVEAGGVYPVATVGAELPGGLKIKKSKLRGEPSHGMLCSAVELGIAESADGLLPLDEELVPGMPITEALRLEDAIIDIDLTPNRADCFSVVGIARDVAAVNEVEFVEPEVPAVPAQSDATHPPRLAAGAACPAFATRIIRGIDPAAESPLWLRERLRRSGVRPLHPVVDVTNYVMLELGQPMHAYDLSRVSGTLTARFAQQSEKLTLLDEHEIELTADVLVIADDTGPVALAGIMGGAATAVADSTVDVVLESAFFAPAALAGRARRYGLHTDASMRFERGVDFTGQVRAIERATQLITDIAGGVPGPVSEARDEGALPERAPVDLRRSRLIRLLGVELPDATVDAMLARLGFEVETGADLWRVTPPPARFDIAIEEDLVEEVIRLYGYDRVPEIPQSAVVPLSAETESVVSLSRAAALLVDRGYQEAITYSFVDPKIQDELLGEAPTLTLANPLSIEMSAMRRSLWPGLLQVVQANRKRQQDRVRVFESGVIFGLQGNELKEKESIGGVAWGRVRPEHWDDPRRSTDLFDIKSDIDALIRLTGRQGEVMYVAGEHPSLRPGATAEIRVDNQRIGWLGELHPRIARRWNLDQPPVLFELDAAAALQARVPAYKAISRFPSVRRDLAIVVSEDLPVANLIAEIRAVDTNVLRDVRVFDVYTGERVEKGLKSVALGLILQETSRTLTEPEIEGVIDSVIEQISGKFNASIRE